MFNRNYNVSFAFCSEDGSIVGELAEKKMKFSDIEHTLRILSPLMSVEWTDTIKALPRNSYTICETRERVQTGQILVKRVKVRR